MKDMSLPFIGSFHSESESEVAPLCLTFHGVAKSRT